MNTTSNENFNLNNITMSLTAKKTEEKPLPHSRSHEDPVDLTHLGGYGEMEIKEIHHGDHEGPNNEDDGFVIVMQDAVGNKRVGKISRRQLRKTFREIGWDVDAY